MPPIFYYSFIYLFIYFREGAYWGSCFHTEMSSRGHLRNNLNTSVRCIPENLGDVITCFPIIHMQTYGIPHSEVCDSGQL